MEDQKVLSLLKKITKVLQGNYKSVAKCKEDISSCLEDIDKMAIEISGERIVKRETVTEALANGLWGQGSPTKENLV